MLHQINIIIFNTVSHWIKWNAISSLNTFQSRVWLYYFSLHLQIRTSLWTCISVSFGETLDCPLNLVLGLRNWSWVLNTLNSFGCLILFSSMKRQLIFMMPPQIISSWEFYTRERSSEALGKVQFGNRCTVTMHFDYKYTVQNKLAVHLTFAGFI